MATFVETANAALTQLRNRRGRQALVSGERLAPGVWFDMDTAGADHEAHCARPSTGLIEVSLQARRPGRWFTLNVDLGNDDMAPHRLFGFALRGHAPRTTLARVCVRNFHEGGYEDAFFPLQIALFAEESSHADVLWPAHEPGLRRPANWRTLLIFFDPVGFQVTLTDMRLFMA